MKVHLKKVNRTCIPIWVVTLVTEKKKKVVFIKIRLLKYW